MVGREKEPLPSDFSPQEHTPGISGEHSGLPVAFNKTQLVDSVKPKVRRIVELSSSMSDSWKREIVAPESTTYEFGSCISMEFIRGDVDELTTRIASIRGITDQAGVEEIRMTLTHLYEVQQEQKGQEDRRREEARQKIGEARRVRLGRFIGALREGAEPFDYGAIDERARAAGVDGINLMPIPPRVRTFLSRQGYATLTSVAHGLDDKSLASTAWFIAEKSLSDINTGLEVVKQMQPEEIDERLTKLTEPKPKVKKEKKPPLLPQLAPLVYERVGREVADDVRMWGLQCESDDGYFSNEEFGMYLGARVPESWAQMMREFNQYERSAIEGALVAARYSRFKHVGTVRRASFIELREEVGEGTAMLLYQAFGDIDREPRRVEMIKNVPKLEPGIKARVRVEGGHLYRID